MSVLGKARFYFKQCIILYTCQLYINSKKKKQKKNKKKQREISMLKIVKEGI